MYYDEEYGWYFCLDDELDSSDPNVTVSIVFVVALPGGADEASAVALTADVSHLTDGWYKVENDLTIYHTLNLHGDTHITISGATLTVSSSSDYGIKGFEGSTLTISGKGTLNVSSNWIAIFVPTYTQTGYTLVGITVTPAVTVTDLGSGSYSFTVPAAP